MTGRRTLGFTAFLLASAALGSTSAFAATCESLTGLKLPDTTILTATSQAAGTFAPPRPNGAAGRPVATAFCRVTGSIKPTSDSDIRFEVWLPLTGWTGRYESVGNGGYAGAISYNDMLSPIAAGSAVASTDDGHESRPNTDTAWAVGHPEKVIDFAYRAVHLTAVVGKAVTEAFYGKKASYNYFIGCSTGGREAQNEAQRYPDDFDGISAGDPAANWSNEHSADASNMKTFVASEAGYISQDQLQKLGQAVIDQCDEVDGVKDGLINDPRMCKIDRSKLPLTAAQVKTYDAMIAGTHTSKGELVFPGMPYSSEGVGWGQYFAGPSFAEAPAKARRAEMANNTFTNLVYHDPNWTFLNYDPDKSPVDIRKAMGSLMDAMNPSYAGFKAHGGKLISYHGWADSDISPFTTVNFYNATIKAQGGLDKTQAFYRLFMVPGMGHCGGGPGPNAFGQYGGTGDADHDVVAALEQWVEKGIAPTRIVATRYSDPERTKPTMTRPLCMFPNASKYKGTGDTNDAANFVCAPSPVK
jgi:feruloyl esterase